MRPCCPTTAGAVVTGGRIVAALELAPGTHALVCTNDANGLYPLADLAIAP